MDKKIRFGVIGLGCRGLGTMVTVLFPFDEIIVTAVCDTYEDRADEGAKAVFEKYGTQPFSTTDFNQLLARDDVDAVYIACSWEDHIKVAIAALNAKKAVALEVGGAYNTDELWELVDAYEKTKTPFMFMENCCFGKTELLVTSMARRGLFGEIVHCSGAYAHDLRGEICGGNINRHYRLRNYADRNTENYPTHELGPIAKLLNINRGNRFVSLVSVSSKARGLAQYISDHEELTEKDPSLKSINFMQGDIVNTVITCENGETVALKLDTTLPRSYSREFTVRGTKGAYFEDSNSFYFDGMDEFWTTQEYMAKYANNAAEYAKKYLPEVWKNITEEQLKSGHGGMDTVEFQAFIDAYLKGEEMPVDVYDAAAWMAVSALAERSIAEGGAPQAFPDFTKGAWRERPCADVMKL
ncbi:MAG: Gfo/Idh/MocA family oxidoreductase [Ruminococcaceae bacterium]|nr:Gfo/Idh/MocA family oxidoreductase [Oscillospiraceae bacterium]